MPATEDYDRFKGIAEELGLEGEDGENFVNSAMKRKGYKPSMVWNDPEPEEQPQGDNGDFFTNRKKAKEEKAAANAQPKEKASGGGGWQYS